MLDALREVGIDLEELDLFSLALCKGAPINEHYDSYEVDDNVARITDERCLSCPIMVQCLQRGIDNNEWGVWGAVYLTSGKRDASRNAHKTPEVEAEIRRRISEQSVL